MRSATLAAVVAVALVLSGCEGEVINSEEDAVYDMERDIASLQVRIAELEARLACVTLENGGDDFVFTGVNVHVRSASGSTDGSVNGRGNLIVGYNEATGSQTRTGSHNLIVGPEHEYTSYGGVVAGYENTISGRHASVTGGERGIASGRYSSVTGGYDNDATGWYASVAGGQQNGAGGVASSVAGGLGNATFADHATVSGGASNTASGWYSSVGGGYGSTASGDWSSVGGGSGSVADEDYSHVCGGLGNNTTVVYDVLP